VNVSEAVGHSKRLLKLASRLQCKSVDEAILTRRTCSPLFGDGSSTKFFVVRHTNYAEESSASYKLTLPTSEGTLSIPQFGGILTLSGRDSKWHVTDYDLAGTNLLYSTAEIFTWKDYGDKKILIVYGGPNEQHELAISNAKSAPKLVCKFSELLIPLFGQFASFNTYLDVSGVLGHSKRVLKLKKMSGYFLIKQY
jgi:hypothetical protein